MKKLLTLFITIIFLAGLIFTNPAEKPAKADYTMPTLVSITQDGTAVDPTKVVDIATLTDDFPSWDAEHAAAVFGWMITDSAIPVGTEFKVIIDTKFQEPYVAVTEAEMQNWSYNAITGYTTVNVKSIFIPGRQGGPDMNGLIVALALGMTDPNAPAEQIKGMYVSTNAYEWEMIPPKDEKNMKFGYIIKGKTGYKDGFYKMYMPKALLDFMHIKPEEMAGFVDGSQYATKIIPTADGGVIISITLEYSTRRVEAGKALPLSLAATKTSIKEGKKTNLFGWLGTKKKGKTVELYKKEKGETSYTLVTKLTTKKKGYFISKQAPTKNTSYKAMWKNKKGKKVWSPVQKVKVK